MAKSKQPDWVGKLRRQLKRAGEKDPDLSRFGARSHKYQLKLPVSEETIAAFEKRFGISLPEGYRKFLLWIGDGGALLWPVPAKDNGALSASGLLNLPLESSATVFWDFIF